MASPAQIAANRRNAMQSTGPRTEAGKAASRFNALRHGADARSAVIPGEDPAELEELAESYYAHFRPRRPEECFLVDTLVQSDWLRRRFLRLETEMTNHLLAESEPCANPLGALYCTQSPGARALDRVRRYYEAADRAWFKASRDLDRLRRQFADEQIFGIGRPARIETARAETAPIAPAAEPDWVRSPEIPLPDAPAGPRIAAHDPRLALRL
jgi:hypothetical protein